MSAAAVDSMIVDYLIQGMGVGYDPGTDPDQALASEREAVFRLFLWAEMTVLPTVLKQLVATRHPAWRDRLETLVLIHLPEAQIPPGAFAAIEARTLELLSFHNDALDCRIVAEAESVGTAALLSFDHRLRKRLGPNTTLPLLTPSEYWARLAIPHGTQPRWTPASSNPMSHESWWHW